MNRGPRGSRPPGYVTHAAPRGARTDRSPAVADRVRATREPMVCERCGAVYKHKTWRAGTRTQRTSLVGVGWTLCPACAQVEDQEYFGRLRITKPLGPAREAEVRRRVWNVEKRARYTQPERRTVRIDRVDSGYEILTTSQKLAHRIARELEKAFGGKTRFVWTDREGMLDATWDPPAERVAPAGEPTRRPRIKQRTLQR